jgi:hypothetical protein
MVHAGLAPDDDLATGDREVDPNLEDVALLVPPMRTFDDNAARDDAIEKAIELLGPLADARLQRSRRLHVAEGDL